MRNKYTGKCYVCGKLVEKGQGHFERYKGGWRVQCACHPIEKRQQKIQQKTTEEKEPLANSD